MHQATLVVNDFLIIFKCLDFIVCPLMFFSCFGVNLLCKSGKDGPERFIYHTQLVWVEMWVVLTFFGVVVDLMNMAFITSVSISSLFGQAYFFLKLFIFSQKCLFLKMKVFG